MLGNMERSAQLFTNVLEKDPARTACLYELADIQLGANRVEEAIVLAEAAYTADRRNAWYALFLAELCMSVGKVERTIEILKASLKENRKNERIYFLLATAYESQGSYEDASALISDLEGVIGSDPELMEMKIDLLLKSNDLNGALKERKRVWEEDKGNIDNGMKYIEMLMVNGKKEEGEMLLLEMHNRFPEDGMTCYMLSEYYRQRMMEKEFIEMITCAFNDKEFDIDKKMGVLLAMLKLSSSEEVSEKIKELLDVMVLVHPAEAKTYAIAGDYYLQKGNRVEAEINFRRTVEIDSSRLPVWEELVRLNIELGRYRRANELCQRAIELFPINGSIRVLSGIAQARRGFYREAEEELIEAVKYVKTNPSISVQLYAELGFVQSGLGRLEESDKSFTKALGISPDNPNVLANYAASLLQRSEQLERAEEMAQRACSISPGNPYYEDVYARILSVGNKHKDAKVWIKKALSNSLEDTSIIIEHCGDILFRGGEKEEAIKNWRRALELGGDNEQLRKKVSEGAL